jgi:AraC-like DNA-binding protein
MDTPVHFHYLPVLPAQRQWGLYLTDCGYTEIGPGSPYPPRRHPDAYHFDWRQGRTLAEYQAVYITRGSGVFEAKGTRRLTVEAGDVFLLFPGVWHRYAPNPATGWDEHWIGFNGPLADRLLRHPFFHAKKPLLRIGLDTALRQRFIALVRDTERDPAGAPFSSAGRVIEILGCIQERGGHADATGRRLSDVIRKAQNHILANAQARIDFAGLAHTLGISYSTFRRSFKRQLGVAPAQFQNAIRINRALDLLAATDQSVSEIADRTGFDTVFYFSRQFKQKTGITPTAFRLRARGPAAPAKSVPQDFPPQRRTDRI